MREKVTSWVLRHSDFTACLVLVLMVLLFFANIFLPHVKMFVHPDYGQSDLWQQTYASKYFLSESLKSGQLPFWNPYIGNGYPEFAKAEMGTFNIFNMMFLSSFSFPVGINLVYLSVFLLLSLSTYLYGRLLKLSVLASLFTAIIFAFSSFFITKFPHLSRIQTISYMPLMLSLTILVFRTHRFLFVFLLSVIAAQQFFSGHAQMIFITYILVACQVGYLFIQQKRDFKGVAMIALSGALYIPLIAVQLFPTLELLQKSDRSGGLSIELTTFFSYAWSSLGTLLNPFILGSTHDGTYPSERFFAGNMYWENITFFSIVGVVLVGFGLLRQKNLYVRFYTILAVIALLFMTGKYSPLYFIHTIQPFSFFRAPAKYIVIFLWALVLISGFGFDRLREMLQKKFRKSVVLLVSVVLILISYSELYRFYRIYTPLDKPSNWISSSPQQDESFLTTPTFNSRYIVLGTEDLWNDQFISNGWKDLDSFRSLHLFAKPNANTFTGHYSPQMYNILLVNRYGKMNGAVFKNILESRKDIKVSPVGDRLLDLNGVRYIVSAKPVISAAYTLSARKQVGTFYMHVYEIQKPLSRAYFATQTQKITTVKDFIDTTASESYDPHAITLVEDDIVASGSSQARVDITNDSGNQIQLRTDTDAEQLLVLADTYYPGWTAYVDGNETEIFPANLNQKAILVPSGKHSIIFKYQPAQFATFARVSATTHLITVLVTLLLALRVWPIHQSFLSSVLPQTR